MSITFTSRNFEWHAPQHNDSLSHFGFDGWFFMRSSKRDAAQLARCINHATRTTKPTVARP